MQKYQQIVQTTRLKWYLENKFELKIKILYKIIKFLKKTETLFKNK